jgi:hypothetical protein
MGIFAGNLKVNDCQKIKNIILHEMCHKCMLRISAKDGLNNSQPDGVGS